MQHRISVSSRKVSQLKHSALPFYIWLRINGSNLPYLNHQLSIWRSLFARYNPCYLQKQHRWKRSTSKKLYSTWRIVVRDPRFLSVIVCVYLGVSHFPVLNLLLGRRMKNRMLFSIDWVLLCRQLSPVGLHIDFQKKRIFWSRPVHSLNHLVEMSSNVNSCIDVPDSNKGIEIENFSALCEHHWILSNAERWISFFFFANNLVSWKWKFSAFANSSSLKINVSSICKFTISKPLSSLLKFVYSKHKSYVNCCIANFLIWCLW